MLRDVMRFDAIGEVLSYVNGNADDRADDIVSESKLYVYISDALTQKGEISSVIKDYTPTVSGARERLLTALEIILCYYKAAQARKTADELYKKTFN